MNDSEPANPQESARVRPESSTPTRSSRVRRFLTTRRSRWIVAGVFACVGNRSFRRSRHVILGNSRALGVSAAVQPAVRGARAPTPGLGLPRGERPAR